MLVRHQRALAGFVGGVILAAAIMYGTVNVRSIEIVIFSGIGVIIAIAAGWYAFKR